MRRDKSGYTLLEIMIIFLIIGILLIIALPNFYKVRLATRKAICVNNLRQIEGAIDRWVLENGVSMGVTVTAQQEDEIYSYLRGGKPLCPSEGIYTIGSMGIHPQVTCNIESHELVEE